MKLFGVGIMMVVEICMNHREDSTMKYDFTTIMDRHGKDAIAIDGVGLPGKPGLPDEGFDVIPMWIADMNFPTVPSVQEAIIKRVNHPAFGYFAPS